MYNGNFKSFECIECDGGPPPTATNQIKDANPSNRLNKLLHITVPASCQVRINFSFSTHLPNRSLLFRVDLPLPGFAQPCTL